MAAPFRTTSTPGVYRRGGEQPGTKPTYYASVTVDGETKKIAAGKKISDAIALKRRLEAERDRGVDVFGGREKEKFVDYARGWLASYSGRGQHRVSTRTVHEYGRDLERHVFPWMAQTTMGRVGRKTLRDLVAHLQSPGYRAPGDPDAQVGLSDATVRRIMAPVRALLSDAHENGDIASNPSVGVRVLAARRSEEDVHVKALTKVQLLALIDAIDPRYRPLVRLLAVTGLRIGEALALRWQDIDLGNVPQVHVRRALKRAGAGTLVMGPPKSRYGHRRIPLPPSVAMELRLARAESEFGRDGDLVFTLSGVPLDASNLRSRYFKPAAVAVGAPWAGFHTLRHTFASLKIAEGASIVQVQRLLGHHSAAFTLSRYVHLMDDGVGGPLELDVCRSCPQVDTLSPELDVTQREAA